MTEHLAPSGAVSRHPALQAVLKSGALKEKGLGQVGLSLEGTWTGRRKKERVKEKNDSLEETENMHFLFLM